jgi:CO/xanthine dehydrogenase Mo-binding subunit
MQGVGHVLTEEVVEDEASGANLTDSTWTYKPPGIAELPQVRRLLLLLVLLGAGGDSDAAAASGGSLTQCG